MSTKQSSITITDEKAINGQEKNNFLSQSTSGNIYPDGVSVAKQSYLKLLRELQQIQRVFSPVMNRQLQMKTFKN